MRARAHALPTVVAAFVAVAAVGCASVPPPDAPLADVPDSWRLEGRLALSNGRDGGSGRLEWTHGAGADQMRFHGALGRGSWRLAADESGVSLTLADGRLFRAQNAEALVREELGWDIPVTELRDWVLGRPAAFGDRATRRDDSGRLEVLEQAGWTIRYEGYVEYEGRWMPRKITADRDENRVRLLVTDWAFADVSSAGE